MIGSLLIGIAGGTPACKYPEDHGHTTLPVESAPVATPAPSAPEPGPIEDPGPPIAATEARRTTLKRLADDEALVPHEAVLREHFGNPISFPLAVQTDRSRAWAASWPRRMSKSAPTCYRGALCRLEIEDE